MLTEKSYTRITLALDIIKKLESGNFAGYHELNLIKHQINLYDTITVEDTDKTEILCNDSNVPTDSANLCWKAADLLKQGFNITKNAKITIEKNIPVQGGLAGGSANAATTFMLLNKLWDLNLSTEQLIRLGKKIGMDIPFYFIGSTAFDTESTGKLEPINTNLELNFILVLPEFGVSTKEAYQDIDYSKIAHDTEKTKLIRSGFENSNKEQIINNLHNDFELSVFQKFPQLKQIKEDLLKAGCLNAVMSGSGSTIIGITKSQEHAKEIQQKLDYNSIIAQTK